MQVQFKNGMFSVTAETKAENETLFHFVNGGDTTTAPKKKVSPETIEKIRKSHKARKEVECPICGQKCKNLKQHMFFTHGIDPLTGKPSNFINHPRNGRMEVRQPVVQLPNGEYKLQKKTGLLG